MTRPILLSCIAIVVYTANIWGTSIYILDEAKNASCAMEMLQRNDLIVPTFNNELRTDKPPLHYYFMMLAYSLFGVSAFSARLFSAMAGVVLTLYLFRKVSKLANEQTALYSSLISLSSVQLAVQFHMAVPDPYLILCLAVAFISLYELIQGKAAAFFPFYLSIAFGFLTKGLIALVFPGLVAIAYLVYTNSFTWYVVKRLQLIKGAAIFLLITLPWYIAVGMTTDGEWLRGFFLDHNINRYVSTMEGHRGYFFTPLLFLLAATFPYSVFIIRALSWIRRFRRDEPFIVYCLFVIVIITVFFSFSKTMLPGYIGPVIPFMAIVLGRYLNAVSKEFSPSKVFVPFFIALFASIAIPIAGYIGLEQYEPTQNLKSYAILFSLFPLSVLAGWIYARGFVGPKLVLSWSVGWIISMLSFFYLIYPNLDDLNPVNKSKSIRSQYANYRLIGYGKFNPAFVFDNRKPIENIKNLEQLKSVMAGQSEQVLVITRSKYLNDLLKVTDFKVVFRSQDLFEHAETVILIR